MNILIICDQRPLLKQLYACLSATAHTVFSARQSLSCIDDFMKYKPSLIIVDEDAILPYPTILEQFNGLHWNYRAVLLVRAESTAPLCQEHLTCFYKFNLTADKLTALIDNLLSAPAQEVADPELELPFEIPIDFVRADSYQFVAFQFLQPIDGESYRLEAIEQTFLRYTQGKILYQDERTVISLNSKSRFDAEPMPLLDAAMKELREECTVFFSTYIPWNQLPDTYTALEKALPLGYFFVGKIVNFDRLVENRKAIALAQLDESLLGLLRCILEDRALELELRLEELVLHQLASALELGGMQYVRHRFWLMERLVCATACDKAGSTLAAQTSMERDFKEVAARANRMRLCLQQKKCSDLTKKALLFVFSNYKSDISLESTAGVLQVSKVYLSRIFKVELTVTFLEMLHLLRVQASKHMLRYTDMKIGEIAESVGFQDAHYFSRLFKKRTSLPPEAYRQTMRRREDESTL